MDISKYPLIRCPKCNKPLGRISHEGEIKCSRCRETIQMKIVAVKIIATQKTAAQLKEPDSPDRADIQGQEPLTNEA